MGVLTDLQKQIELFGKERIVIALDSGSRIRKSAQIFREGTQMGALCSREESNLHGFPHTVLSRTRLPFRHVSVALSGL